MGLPIVTRGERDVVGCSTIGSETVATTVVSVGP
ncbi:Uncharacterised protein [Mycobacteroides abscessus subsp. abscessus]|nr:Uncharacterised protein [Mycobacteroides abscessus subsp. abscessus]